MKLPDWLKHIKGSMDSGSEPVHLLLSANIGYDPETGEGIDAAEFGHALTALKGRDVTLDINSLGGRIDQGTAMYHMIKTHGRVTTRVIGYAASMGAVVHQAGAKRQVMPGTCIMIHNPMSSVQDGDYRELGAASERMKMIKDSMVDILHATTKAGKKKIADMMDATTFMDHKMALELGFADEVVEGSPAYNAADTALLFQNFRQLPGPKGSAAGDSKQNNKDTKIMKLLIAALAKAKLLPSADLTDEAACVSNLETNLAALNVAGLQTEVQQLKTKLTGFENAQKTRVTGKVEAAITNKLVKAERKDALIAVGLRDEGELDLMLADLAEVKGQAAPVRRGAPPVPVKGAASGDEKQAQIDALRAEMSAAETSPLRKSEIAQELRTLRGHGKLFEAKA